MEFVAILALITKGLTIANALMVAGENAKPILTKVIALIRKSFSGQAVTQVDLDELEAFLDAQIDEFNVDLPPA